MMFIFSNHIKKYHKFRPFTDAQDNEILKIYDLRRIIHGDGKYLTGQDNSLSLISSVCKEFNVRLYQDSQRIQANVIIENKTVRINQLNKKKEMDEYFFKQIIAKKFQLWDGPLQECSHSPVSEALRHLNQVYNRNVYLSEFLQYIVNTTYQ